jgi:hypothetical protein
MAERDPPAPCVAAQERGSGTDCPVFVSLACHAIKSCDLGAALEVRVGEEVQER